MAKPVVGELVHQGKRFLVIGYSLKRPAAFARLTPAEVEVVERWLEGASMREIAAARGCSLRTVANQIASIYKKLEIGSRVELLALVHREDGPGARRPSDD